MIQKTLSARIDHLIHNVSNGSQTAFAKKIGIAQPTLNRNLKAQDDEKLMDYTGRILLAMPEIDREWLLTGEGKMYSSHSEEPLAHDVLEEVVETLEAALIASGTELSPKDKARAVRLLYQLKTSGASNLELTTIAEGLAKAAGE